MTQLDLERGPPGHALDALDLVAPTDGLGASVLDSQSGDPDEIIPNFEHSEEAALATNA